MAPKRHLEGSSAAGGATKRHKGDADSPRRTETPSPKDKTPSRESKAKDKAPVVKTPTGWTAFYTPAEHEAKPPATGPSTTLAGDKSFTHAEHPEKEKSNSPEARNWRVELFDFTLDDYQRFPASIEYEDDEEEYVSSPGSGSSADASGETDPDAMDIDAPPPAAAAAAAGPLDKMDIDRPSILSGALALLSAAKQTLSTATKFAHKRKQLEFKFKHQDNLDHEFPNLVWEGWQGINATLGKGGQGCTRLFVRVDQHNNISERMAVKETYVADWTWQKRDFWQINRVGRDPREVVTHKLCSMYTPQRWERHIVAYKDHSVNEENRTFRTYMEYCDGGDLHGVIAAQKREV